MIGVLLPAFARVAAAQVVTTDPAFPAVDQPVTVFFHAAAGAGGLAGFTGDVYAHTGVITDRSTSPSDWKYVKTGWGQNTAETKLERIAPDEYRLTIPDVRAYYGVPASEEIRRLAFVFRSADARREGKDTGGADIFVDLAQDDLNVRITAPHVTATEPLIATRDTTVEVVVVGQARGAPLAWLRLVADGAVVAEARNDTLTYALVLDTPGRVDLTAYVENVVGEADSVSFYAVRNPGVVQAARPAGTVDGINYHPGDPTKVTLSLFAPFKQHVYVLGDFNDWQVDPAYFMRRDAADFDSAYFWITLEGLEPGREYAFQYLVDGAIRVADPYTEKILSLEDGGIPAATYPGLKPYPVGKASQIVSVFQTARPAYDWQVDDFARPAPEKLVIYEMLVRDFVARHDFATLVDTLDYLSRLGVNAIELMPVNEFEGNESWGYNTAGFYFAPDKYYGPAEDLKRFVDEAHRRGMAVLLDLVLNHSYGSSPMVRMYLDAGGRPSTQNPWFNPQHNFANTDAHWGYDFDHESAATQYLVDRVTRYWLEEFRVDGFRFDFTKGFSNNFKPLSDAWGSLYDADRVRLLRRMADAMWAVAPGSYAIMEHLAEDREDRTLADYGILLWGNMNHSYSEAAMGWHDSAGKSDFSHGYYRARGWTQPRLITYMESHDEERLMSRNLRFGNAAPGYDVKDLAVALDRMKMAGAFFFTLPGPKMIWQFGELGYDVSIDDPCRVCNKPIRWDYANDPLRRKLYKSWAALLALRHAHEVFTSPETQVTQAVRSATKRINLTHPSMNVTIVGNFDVRPASVNPNFQSAGTWYDFFTGQPVEVASTTAPLLLQPGEFHVYTSLPVAVPEADLITVGAEEAAELPAEVTLAQNYPNPFNPATTIAYALPQAGPVRLEVFDLLGRRVALLVDEPQAAGTHTLVFDAHALSSGTYLLRLQAADRTEVKRMTLVK